MNMWNQTYEVDCEHVVCPNCTTDEKPVETRTEIKIPLKREEIESTKKSYVIEEVIVKKKPVTETQTITEEVTSEKITEE